MRFTFLAHMTVIYHDITDYYAIFGALAVVTIAPHKTAFTSINRYDHFTIASSYYRMDRTH